MLWKHYHFLAKLLPDSERTFLCGVSNCCPGAEHTNKLTHEHYCFSFPFFVEVANTEVKLMGTGDGRREEEKHNGTVWDPSTGVRAVSVRSHWTNQGTLWLTNLFLIKHLQYISANTHGFMPTITLICNMQENKIEIMPLSTNIIQNICCFASSCVRFVAPNWRPHTKLRERVNES